MKPAMISVIEAADHHETSNAGPSNHHHLHETSNRTSAAMPEP